MEKWDDFYPIHIACTFHNPEVLLELLQYDVDVNLRTDDETKLTPLILAAGNDTQESGFQKQSQRLSTVHLLLNFSCNHGNTALNISCCNGQDSIY